MKALAVQSYEQEKQIERQIEAAKKQHEEKKGVSANDYCRRMRIKTVIEFCSYGVK